ncbi:polyamine transport protein PotI [Pseudomonas aeruginosa]|nr:polyamine transport protein PotI [Pseudomonas aeruginosa]
MKFANSLKKRMPTGRHAVIGVPFLWLFLFFLLPFAIVLKISLAEADVAIPPYTEIFAYADQQLQVLLNLGNYLMLTDDPLYIDAYLGSLKMAFISTLICLLVGYPMAYAIARSSQSSQTVLLLLIMMPTWTAILIRVYAWMGILSNNGLLNSVLMGLGLISEPLTILNTNIAVYIGIVYSYLPFMILPLYANLVKHDPSLLEAASDLGARNFTSFWKITRAAVEERHHRRLHAGVHPGGGRVRHPGTARRPRDPDDRQGALAGVLQQPRLAGGVRPGGGDAGDPDHPDHPVQQEPGQRTGGQGMKRWNFSNVMLIVGLLFIYLPMLILVIYSFNASKLVTVWGGWSVKWYVGLLDNTQLVSSVGRSLEIAFYTAFSSVLLGTLAAFVLTRIPRFRGRTLFGGMVTAPLVMPEVITGLSLLLLFVAMAQLIGWPQERGIVTIWIAHTSFCSSYVAVVVSARLRELDLSIEEAAMDLGAKPWKVFLLITIPMIAPSLAAGGMMSFALSLDDLVLASFVSGPGSTTLPMEVFSAVRLGVKPEINAVASLILLSVSLFTFFAWYFTRQAEERRRRAIQQAMEETATDWQKGSPTPA